MTQDAWPSPDVPSGPLPRIADLPIAEQGYEQEAVRLAFDSFYRHAAQLDASLRSLEAVEVFRRDADALRNDLRALRELGLGGLPEPAWPSLRYEAVGRREVPAVALRLAGEAALIVAVAVIAAVSNFRPLVVVVLMAAAFVIVAFSEWLGARARFVSPAMGFMPTPVTGEAEADEGSYAEAAAPVWAAPEPDEHTDENTDENMPPEALTMVGSADAVPDPAPEPVDEDEPAEEPNADELEEPDADEGEEPDADEEEEAVFDPWEQPGDLDASGEEPELVERGGFFRRRRR
jgi:hypothetical protein